MGQRVEVPFRVASLTEPQLASQVAAVRERVLAHDSITAVELTPGDDGAVAVRAEVALDESQEAGRTVMKAIKTAVKAVGSDDAWKLWELDGPTRITTL